MGTSLDNTSLEKMSGGKKWSMRKFQGTCDEGIPSKTISTVSNEACKPQINTKLVADMDKLKY